jgi:hypothetical protein
MARSFNVSGPCRPDKHYMVDLESRLEEIRQMIDAGEYFVINRARQYGKGDYQKDPAYGGRSGSNEGKAVLAGR